MRDGFIYQNIMYIAAGELAAAVAGTSWEECSTARLFDPLGMDRTRPQPGAHRAMSNVAAPHDEIDGEIGVIENAASTAPDRPGPSGRASPTCPTGCG